MSYGDREIVTVEQFMNNIGNTDIWSHVILHHPKVFLQPHNPKQLRGNSFLSLSLVVAVQSSQVKFPDELLSALKSLEISIKLINCLISNGKVNVSQEKL